MEWFETRGRVIISKVREDTMAGIPKKVVERFLTAMPKFQKVVQIAKDRDLNESDTVAILNDILAEVFGYDKYLEVTSELMIRGTYCDLAIKIEDKFQFLIEAKAVGIELKDHHVKQAIDYGANKGIQWVMLTNSIDWRVYRIRFEQPINYDLVCSFNFLNLNAKIEKDQDTLFLLCKEGLAKTAREDYFEMVQNVNRYVIGHLLLGEVIICDIRKELRKLSEGLRVEEEVIENILRNEVMKREIFEGDESGRAKQKVAKLYRAKIQRPKKVEDKPCAQAVTEAPKPEEQSLTEKLLQDAEKGKE
jgi:predicted type IV restriction endonuclease